MSFYGLFDCVPGNLKVLLLHNQYQQAGGEDVVVRAERELLESHGDEVALLEADNADIDGLIARVKAAAGTIYSPRAKSRVVTRIAAFRPDVVHVHNFFPLLSPSIYYACREAGPPVVQTLHNYRLVCPNAQLLRDGRVCEDCVDKVVPWPGVLHSCYRGTRAGSAVVAAMIAVHRLMGTWKNAVDEFVALTDFSRNKLIEGGLPEAKVTVKPNFVPDSGSVGEGRGGFALFTGRLSPEKGITTLLSAWKRTNRAIPLKIAGDGPLASEVCRSTVRGSVEYLGAQPRERVQALMRDAAFLVFPSVWYEGLPMVIVEAFSVGLPVIASNLGSMATLVEHGRTGLHFRPGDAEDLAAKVEWAVSHPEEMARMRCEARSEYLAKYTPERNYKMLMEIYARVTGGKVSAADGLSQASETKISHAGTISQ
jgi:glycosyltransferase involved in cell wall biosynthesis